MADLNKSIRLKKIYCRAKMFFCEGGGGGDFSILFSKFSLFQTNMDKPLNDNNDLLAAELLTDDFQIDDASFNTT